MHETEQEFNVENLKEFFLRRMVRFANLSHQIYPSAWRRLTRFSVNSTYGDCKALGVGEEAKSIIDQIAEEYTHRTDSEFLTDQSPD